MDWFNVLLSFMETHLKICVQDAVNVPTAVHSPDLLFQLFPYTQQFFSVFHCHGGTVAQCLPPLPHSRKVLGLNLYLHESRHAGGVSLHASPDTDW